MVNSSKTIIRLRIGAMLHFVIAIGHIACLFFLEEAFKAYVILDEMNSLCFGQTWLLYAVTIAIALAFIPGTLKLLFDRIVYGMMDESQRGFPKPLHKGKRCVLVSTSTTPCPFNILMHQSHGAIRALKEICRYSGFKIVATIEKGGTRRNTTLSEKEAMKCRKAVRKLL